MVGSFEGRAPIAVVGDNLLTTHQSGLSICVRDNIQGSFKVKGELKVSWIRLYVLVNKFLYSEVRFRCFDNSIENHVTLRALFYREKGNV